MHQHPTENINMKNTAETTDRHTWVVSDTHFGHYNIIKYCNRPYATCEEMDEALISNWNNVVKPNDVVFHLGDFGMIRHSDSSINNIKNIIKRLNGDIYLILGNHDRSFSTDLSVWYMMGFKKVYDCPILFMDKYILSHEPISGKNGIDLQYHPHLKNIHGHIHNNNDLYFERTDGIPKSKQIPHISSHTFNASVEMINYTPIRFEEIVYKMMYFKR